MPLAAIDAPQGCVDTLIAIPPALQRKHRTSDGPGGHGFNRYTKPASEEVALAGHLMGGLAHTWLGLPTQMGSLTTSASMLDYRSGVDISGYLIREPSASA